MPSLSERAQSQNLWTCDSNVNLSTLPMGEVGQIYYALKKSSPFVNSC